MAGIITQRMDLEEILASKKVIYRIVCKLFVIPTEAADRHPLSGIHVLRMDPR